MTVRSEIRKIEEHKKEYRFNIIGLLAVGFHKKVHPKRSFYCAEFVKYLLEISKIETNLPTIIKPEDFKKLENYTIIYTGKLRKYNKEKIREYIAKCLEICTKRRNEVV